MQVATRPWFRWWLDRTKEKEICRNQNDRSNGDSRWHKTVRQKNGLEKIDIIKSFESFFNSTSNFNFFNQLAKYHSDANAMRSPPQKVRSCKFGEGSERGRRPRDCPFCLGWKERGGGGGGGRKQYFSRNWAHCSLNKKTQSGQNKTILSQSGSGKSETITDCLPPISTVSPESLILTKPPIIGAQTLSLQCYELAA